MGKGPPPRLHQWAIRDSWRPFWREGWLVMAGSHSLAILVFGSEGALVRYSREALELTGYGPEQVATMSDWCRNLFKDFESYYIAKETLEGFTSCRDEPVRSREFRASFQTLRGDTKAGHFTLVQIGRPGHGERQILISILEQPRHAEAHENGLEAFAMADDQTSRALKGIRTAIADLYLISEETQHRVLSTTAAIRNGQAELSQLWDGLFQEAFTLERVREHLEAIQDAAALLKQALHAHGHLVDPSRPLVRGAIGRPVTIPLGLNLESLKSFWVLSTLNALRGNRSQCAVQLGVSLRTIRNRLEACRREGIKVPPPGKSITRKQHKRTDPLIEDPLATNPQVSSF